MKNYVINRLKEAGITDEDFCNEVFSDCQSAIENTLNEEIDYWKRINDPKNIHEELWQHNDSVFELDVADEEHDWHLEATIEPEEETGLFICHYKESSLGLDRDNIINEIYMEDLGLNENEPIKNVDYKKLMAIIYVKFQYMLDEFIRKQLTTPEQRIKQHMKEFAEVYDFELTENVDKIVKAKLRFFGEDEWYNCPCVRDGEHLCISEKCKEQIINKGVCHCNLFKKRENS